uniref:Acyltransferase n=1 Tax=Ochrobactrum sp. LM19 TaxID=1449781 RepID=A0A0D5A0Q7_9HYPH|nr:acyltransferase [Ochrobactrum sp. LM19]AJW29994.1 acyltransferase [Ochrobactrum sp. LM19]
MMTYARKLRSIFTGALTLTGSIAFAGESAVSLIAAGMPANCAEYAENVSKSEGNFNSTSPVVNGVTCYGAFQFCNSGTFQRYYSGTPQEFLNDPRAQVNVWVKYQSSEWNTAQRLGLDSAVGKEICYRGTCAQITQSSILKACQFGCGKGGKLYNLVASGLDCNAPKTADGAGTSVCYYLISGAGYEVSCITGSNDGINCIPNRA